MVWSRSWASISYFETCTTILFIRPKSCKGLFRFDVTSLRFCFCLSVSWLVLSWSWIFVWFKNIFWTHSNISFDALSNGCKMTVVFTWTWWVFFWSSIWRCFFSNYHRFTLRFAHVVAGIDIVLAWGWIFIWLENVFIAEIHFMSHFWSESIKMTVVMTRTWIVFLWSSITVYFSSD